MQVNMTGSGNQNLTPKLMPAVRPGVTSGDARREFHYLKFVPVF